MRIALFGGSFDPPHLGHVLAATWAWSAGGVDEVWVLPVAQHAYGKPIAPWEQRWALCQAAFDGLGFVRLRDDERLNPGGYTIDLIERLRSSHPDWRFLLVGGSDTARDLVNWHRGQELARLTEIIAVPRSGAGGEHHAAALPAISSSLVRERLASGLSVAGLLPARVAALITSTGWYAPHSALRTPDSRIT